MATRSGPQFNLLTGQLNVTENGRCFLALLTERRIYELTVLNHFE